MKVEVITPRSQDGVRYHAKSKGYSFSLSEKVWVLDKDVKVPVGEVAGLLDEPARTGFLGLMGLMGLMGFYASEMSSHHTQNIAMRFLHMLRFTKARGINDEDIINYRASLDRGTEWYLSVIRGALRRWFRMGYPGISEDVIRLMDGWIIRGNRKGDAIKRMNPDDGPLTDIELQSFNEGAVRVYERKLISLSDLAISLLVSSTGRRPYQISALRVIDILNGRNRKDEPYYLINVPRGKQGEGFRKSFKPFAITEDLWTILSAQAKQSIKRVETSVGVKLQAVDQQQVPIFLTDENLKLASSPKKFRELVSTDMLHITSAEVTEILQFVVDSAQIKSERTGELMWINSRRFRYTTGTRAAREGFGELVIAEILDHSDTQNAGVYIKNIPEHVKRLDEAVGFQLAPYAQAFAGVLVDSEKDAERGNDPTSRIRIDSGQGVGTCGEYGFCGANVPLPCYTCMHFQPWVDGPHQNVYSQLISERKRIFDVTGDERVTAILDRSILAVADVIQRCERRREEIVSQGARVDGRHIPV